MVKNDIMRYIGLEMLINELLMICKYSKFAMKKGNSKEALKKCEDKLKQIKKKKELITNLEKFDKTFDLVIEIKSFLSLLLNENHLILTDEENLDLMKHLYLADEYEELNRRK